MSTKIITKTIDDLNWVENSWAKDVETNRKDGLVSERVVAKLVKKFFEDADPNIKVFHRSEEANGPFPFDLEIIFGNGVTVRLEVKSKSTYIEFADSGQLPTSFNFPFSEWTFFDSKLALGEDTWIMTVNNLSRETCVITGLFSYREITNKGFIEQDPKKKFGDSKFLSAKNLKNLENLW